MKTLILIALLTVSGAAHASLIDANTQSSIMSVVSQMQAIKGGGYKVMNQYAAPMSAAEVDRCEKMTMELARDAQSGGDVHVSAQGPHNERFDDMKTAYNGVTSNFHIYRQSQELNLHDEREMVSEVSINVWEHDGQRDAYLTCIQSDVSVGGWPE